MALELIIPRSALDRQRVLRCLVPGCGKRFPIDQNQQFERHVKACSKKNEDRILEVVEESRSDYFRAPADQELYEHMRKGGT